MLGIGPLLLAPMSETFGRRTIYLLCLTVFTLLQIPTALAPNVEGFIVLRTLTGFFGSVGVGNGGGSISDMMDKDERTKLIGDCYNQLSENGNMVFTTITKDAHTYEQGDIHQ